MNGWDRWQVWLVYVPFRAFRNADEETRWDDRASSSTAERYSPWANLWCCACSRRPRTRAMFDRRCHRCHFHFHCYGHYRCQVDCQSWASWPPSFVYLNERVINWSLWFGWLVTLSVLAKSKAWTSKVRKNDSTPRSVQVPSETWKIPCPALKYKYLKIQKFQNPFKQRDPKEEIYLHQANQHRVCLKLPTQPSPGELDIVKVKAKGKNRGTKDEGMNSLRSNQQHNTPHHTTPTTTLARSLACLLSRRTEAVWNLYRSLPVVFGVSCKNLQCYGSNERHRRRRCRCRRLLTSFRFLRIFFFN